MNPWLETFGVTGLALAGAGLGWTLSKMGKSWWLLGYAVSLLLICSIGLSRRLTALELIPPFSWLMAGRTEFAATGFLGTLILTSLMSRISRGRDRIALTVLMAAVVATAALPPFAAPLFNQAYLQSLKTRFDSDGVCRQSTDYNCGPAAAVTALHRLGYAAEEGQIALWAHTTRFTGTEADVLAEALQRHYGRKGLHSDYRHFKSVSELKGPFLTIARIKFAFLLDHYITVLEVTSNEVVAADPLMGLTRMSRRAFLDKWRFCGVTVSRRLPAARVPSRQP